MTLQEALDALRAAGWARFKIETSVWHWGPNDVQTTYHVYIVTQTDYTPHSLVSDVHTDLATAVRATLKSAGTPKAAGERERAFYAAYGVE